MYVLIVERLTDGILGVKHGVAAFVIQFLECYYIAANCCYLVDKLYKAKLSLHHQVAWEEFANHVNLEMMRFKMPVEETFSPCFLFVQALQTLFA